MVRKRLLEIGAMVALGVNYASAYIAAFIWNWPDPDSKLYVHILAVLFVSLIFGAVIVDVRKTIFYTIGSVVIGVSLATAIISAPSVMLTANVQSSDVSVTVALATVSKLFIIGITFIIMGIFIGCFIGDAISTELGQE